MTKFSSYLLLLVAATAVLFSSCSDDDDGTRATFVLSQSAVYFTAIDQSTVITYSGSDIVELSYDEDDLPDGWSISISRGRQEITITGPTTEDDFESSFTTETVTFTATSYDDLSAYDYLTLGTTELSEDITDQQANSFLVSSPNTIYTFSAEYKGENEESMSPASVDILWQTSPMPLTYARLVDGMVEFHVDIDDDDYDSDDLEDDIIEGNAVIAAYDSSGDIIWSWHIWVSDYSIEESTVTLDGVTLMGRNLGANDNSTYDDDTILESYGLYYQWGRKDPFVGPYYYNAASGTDASMLNQYGSSASITYSESTSTIGTLEYATENPLTFILGVEDSEYDWIYEDHTGDLWGATKTINDPCPKGWRVASPDVYAGLSIPVLSDSERGEIADDYGWYLSDAAGNSALFMGLGRRAYITGKIQNVNLNILKPSPWAGYYWTASSDQATVNSSVAMYFAYDESDIDSNEINNKSLYRSNGMQVRCQRN
ncbi:MAG: FISUMP domain-containing protein [Rikenellaceae bacterium]